ncbi:DNA-3-methyladenine glycosylase family protein [Microvirga pudoricolor]|uniref:DNA-3-methyladenine glycosylase family protein n=1 Tax=Microvirga pudoricolor TaxID=2778729 RepID=UPI001950C75E|nr:DNA-3-methyladenine glycosylase [Microvirga pudoricolor]MBM6595503.1 DNA-3-methyladenine glycosylase 2 family protein [Microvirga pudoricolor]
MTTPLPSLYSLEDPIRTGLDALAEADPVMADLIKGGMVPALRRRPAGFEGLAWIVVGQQLSTASAAAIWARVGDRFAPVTPDAILGASDEGLRAAGLSASKIRTLRNIAVEVAEGRLPLETLQDMPADEAHDRLTALKGIGPWTADVYLLFCLGHPDAFPAGDLAVQEAARIAYGLDERPNARALEALAERWRPWRGVAAKVLWMVYRQAKARDGAPA